MITSLLGGHIQYGVGNPSAFMSFVNEGKHKLTPMAATICRIVEQSVDVAVSKDVFTIATVGGADALGRPDLGRLAAGCKADVVTVRIDTFKAAPLYDPFMFLVLAATGEDVDRVIVDGRTIVENGEVVNVDRGAAIQRLNDAAKKVRGRVLL